MKVTKWGKTCRLAITACVFGGLPLTTEMLSATELQTAYLSVQMESATLRELFDLIEKRFHYSFLIRNNDINLEEKIRLDVDKMSVEEILTNALKNQHADFFINDKRIVVYKKISKPGSGLNTILPGIQQSKGQVKGQVLDAVTGEPVIGASIIEKGTTNGGITDIDGNFSLIFTGDEKMIEISYIGYVSQVIKITSDKVLSVKLKEDTQTLSEVVVVGYGVQKRENLTGAVSVVQMDKVLGDRPVTSVMSALQGTMPGLVISGGSTPGQSKEFNIRGTTSLNGGEPLVLVDNVPAQIDLINPEDIESVSVLKDAASAAIYGARAAFGVILITTKKAKKGSRLQLNYNNNFGFINSINRPQQADALSMLQAYKDAEFLGGKYFGNQDVDLWMQYIREYRENPGDFETTYNGIYIPKEDNPGKVRYYLHENDLYKNMLDKFGFQQTHNVSASGGSEAISYRLSLGYTNNQGVLITNKDSYKRLSASSYVSADITEWLNTSLDIRYAKGTKRIPYDGHDGNIYGLRLANLNPEGEMECKGEMLPINTPKNYILYADPMTTINENPRIYSRTLLKPLKGLEVAFEYTFDKNIYDQKKYNAPFDYTSIQLNKNSSAATSQYWNTKRTTDYNAINLYGTYMFSLQEKHNFKVMAGFNQESRNLEELEVNRKDMISEEMPSFSGSTGETIAKDKYREYTIRSGFFRVNYDYMNKYLFEVNGRYDGSSKFPKDSRYGFFPSVSLGWQLGEEAFMRWSKSVLSQFKLRGSWGEIGNQAIDEYAFTPLMASELAEWVVDGSRPTTLKAPGLVRSNFTWERVETLDIGFDMSMFNYRLQSTFDWYRRDTKGMLAPGMEFPSVVGATAPLQNTADLRTKGWELAVNWRDKIGEWGYNIGFNLFDSRTHVTKYNNEVGLFRDRNEKYEDAKKSERRYREGMEIGEIWGYVSNGYYTIDDFENTTSWKLKEGVTSIKGTQVRPGDVKFKNLRDHEGSTNQIDEGEDNISNPGDRKIIGNSTSRYQYGITGGVNWKGFDLSFLLQGTGKRDVWIDDALRWAFHSGQFGTIFDNQLDYWKPKDPANGDWTAVNPNAEWHRIYGEKANATSNQRIQTKYLMNGAYLRLKNITLGYNVPRSFLQKITLSSAKIFCSVENLHTWSHLPKGYDPERLSWQYPFYRTISFGVNLTL